MRSGQTDIQISFYMKIFKIIKNENLKNFKNIFAFWTNRKTNFILHEIFLKFHDINWIKLISKLFFEKHKKIIMIILNFNFIYWLIIFKLTTVENTTMMLPTQI